MRMLIIPVLLAALIVPGAHAWHTQTCDGKVMGFRSNRTVYLNRCSIAAGGSRDVVVNYAMNEWDKIPGIADRFNPVSGSSTCSISSGDGRSDVAFVSRESIDGANGVTRYYYEGCVWPYLSAFDGDYKEADVLLASDLNLGTPPEGSAVVGRYAKRTAIHEFGHALGLKEENDWPAVMYQGAGPALGSRSVYGTLANRNVSVLPDDVDFLARYHNETGGSIDLFVAAAYFDEVTDSWVDNMSTIANDQQFCAGSPIALSYALGNKGETSVASATFWLVLSTDSVISQSDRYLFGQYWSASRGNYTDVVRRSITIPATTPVGYYYVGAVIDLDNRIAEYDEGNNAVRFSKRIYVKRCS